MNVLVEDNPARRRFELLVDGSLAGYAEYQMLPDTVVFTHTEVDASYQGKGVGSDLVRAALDQVRERGEQVVPHCPFFAAYIDRHPQYADLIATA